MNHSRRAGGVSPLSKGRFTTETLLGNHTFPRRANAPRSPVFVFAAILLLSAPAFASAAERVVKVGSKAFTESVVLGELAKQVMVRAKVPAEHRSNLGGTGVVWEALLKGDLDAYPDYTGTIAKEILSGIPIRTIDDLEKELDKRGVKMTRPLGFDNFYAIGMTEETAERLHIKSISDLRDHPEIRFGFSNEFVKRNDGWPGLRDLYRLPQRDVSGLDHALAYKGLLAGSLDATEVYGTDPQIRAYHLRVLRDDLHYFPEYDAVFLYRKDLGKEAVDALRQLEGRVPPCAIIDMNALAQPQKREDRIPEAQVVEQYLNSNPYFRTGDGIIADTPAGTTPKTGMLQELWTATLKHLWLVVTSLSAAMLVAIPLGIVAARRPNVGQMILGVAGIIQTLPSLALLVFLIPFLGLGTAPAVVALFLYSLLPMIRNTYTGLHDLPVQIRESAEALGLTPFARLRLIELPMASRSILAGVKTSAVINVGTATLGGIIGAGGYGEIIMNGVRLADNYLILEGAIPAALLAVLVQGLFELAERGLVPLGLRLKPAE